MYLEHFGLKKEPFAEYADPEIFFADGEGTNVLRDVYADLQQGESVVLLSGESGAGKTMLCRVLAHLAPSSFRVVYIARPTGSFDELLHSVFTALEIEGSEHDFGKKLELLQEQAKAPQKFLLILDAAEAMFPAALERLIRTVSNLGNKLIQLVLAGQSSLLETIKHLNSYCPDISVPPCHIVPPLRDEEIGPYLQYRLKAAGLVAGSQELFSKGAVQGIVRQAKGDLHKVNRLADQALHQAFAVKARPPLAAAHVAGLQLGVLAAVPTKEGRRLWLVFSIFLLLVGLSFFLYQGFWNVEQEQKMEKKIPAQATLPEKELSVTEKLDLIRKYEPLPAERRTSPPAVEQDLVQEDESEEEQALVAVEVQEEAGVSPSQGQQETEEQEDDRVLHLTPTEVRQPAEAPVVEEKTLIQLSPGMRKTRRGAGPPSGETESPSPQAIISTPKTLPEVQANAALPEEISAEELQQRYGSQTQNHNDADQLYQEMLMAGSRFRNRLYANKYTVNVLSLYVDNAVEQVKSLIVQEDYLAQRQNFYILRKQTRPTALFVFYGIYDTLEQALEASNTLPTFLRRYNPYPLSISNALARATN